MCHDRVICRDMCRRGRSELVDQTGVIPCRRSCVTPFRLSELGRLTNIQSSAGGKGGLASCILHRHMVLHTLLSNSSVRVPHSFKERVQFSGHTCDDSCGSAVIVRKERACGPPPSNCTCPSYCFTTFQASPMSPPAPVIVAHRLPPHYSLIKEIVEGRPNLLLESLAETLCARLLVSQPLMRAVQIHVRKLSIPGLPAHLSSVGESHSSDPQESWPVGLNNTWRCVSGHVKEAWLVLLVDVCACHATAFQPCLTNPPNICQYACPCSQSLQLVENATSLACAPCAVK